MFARANGRRIAVVVAFVVPAAALQLAGCNRAYYREQADQEVCDVIAEKSHDERWALPGFSIEMDPRSRYYDPYDRDRPPMPPDDPDSHLLMHHIDDKDGYSHWHDNGDIEELENPGWREWLPDYVERTEHGQYRLRLEDAIRLAQIHLPSYQQQFETLYLSALDVSTERFRFDVQFFGSNDTTYAHQGTIGRGGDGRTFLRGETNRLDTDTDVSFRRRFATGGELLAGFANSLVWNFAGPDRSTAFSIIDFSLVQPLLRAGGRAVALEQLTIAERTLLANLRAFQFYRQGFYTQMAIGDRGGASGPRRRGGFLGGTGLTGFTGTGSGGFGGVGAATGFGGSGFGVGGGGTGGAGGGTLGAGGGAGNVGGFIGLLQQLQQFRNRQDNLNLQLRTLALLEANQEAGLIGVDQVLQFYQSIETERANLLQAQNALENAIENFNTSNLGMPPDLPIELDDSLIRPFQFLDPRMSAVESAIASFIHEFGQLSAEPAVKELRTAFARIGELRKDLSEQFDIVREDLKQLAQTSEVREQSMAEDERRRFLADKQRLAADLDLLQTRFDGTTDVLRKLSDGLNGRTRRQSADRLVVLNTELLNLVGELSLIQVRSRLESVVLEPFRLDTETAVAVARTNRADWMNNRADLVDSWRLIEFNANELLSGLDITLSGDVGTKGNNPSHFLTPTGNVRAGLEFDAPLTRLLERNNFRQQLINYQQARRQLIQYEDGVSRSLRQTLRGLRQLELNLEIQRRAVAIAVRRVDQAREILNKPVQPAQPGQPPAQFGPTATRDLVDALEALRDAQNNFMSVWLNYHSGRMGLVRDLGLMRLDENGLWIDESLDEAVQRASGDELTLPPPLPDQWASALDNAVQPDDTRDEGTEPRRLPSGGDTNPVRAPLFDSQEPETRVEASERGWRPTRRK